MSRENVEVARCAIGAAEARLIARRPVKVGLNLARQGRREYLAAKW
jgi:hypothetical protein